MIKPIFYIQKSGTSWLVHIAVTVLKVVKFTPVCYKKIKSTMGALIMFELNTFLLHIPHIYLIFPICITPENALQKCGQLYCSCL